LSEGLVKSLAQRLGVSEEDVKLALEWLNKVMSEDEVSKAVSTIATIGEASGRMPESMQKTIAPVLGYALLKQLSTDPLQRQLVALAGGLATIRALLSGDQQSSQLVEKLLERIDKLNEQIQQMREAKTREEFERFASEVNKTLESTTSEVSELKKRLEELASKPSTPPERANPLKAISSQLGEFKEAVTALADALSALGWKVVKPGERTPIHEISDEELRKVAESRGYELKPKALTWEEVDRLMREREERLKKWFRRRLEREVRLKELEAKKWESISAAMVEGFRLLRRILKPESEYEGELEAAIEERYAEGETGGRGVQEAQQGGSQSP
jgi:DNA repair exonuclease SbcCD ATPase subunit